MRAAALLHGVLRLLLAFCGRAQFLPALGHPFVARTDKRATELLDARPTELLCWRHNDERRAQWSNAVLVS